MIYLKKVFNFKGSLHIFNLILSPFYAQSIKPKLIHKIHYSCRKPRMSGCKKLLNLRQSGSTLWLLGPSMASTYVCRHLTILDPISSVTKVFNANNIIWF